MSSPGAPLPPPPAALDSTAAIDRRLVALGEQVERMGISMVDLEADAARILLPTATLSGVTATAWSETEAQIGVLWQLYPATRDAVDQATTERGTRRTLHAVERAGVVAVLTDAIVPIDPGWIAIVEQATGGAIVLASRSSIGQTGAAFDAVLAVVNTVLGDVGRVWDEVLPVLAEQSSALDALDAEATAGGGRVPNEVASVRRLIEQVRTRAASDPLDLDLARVDEIRSGVSRAREVMGQVPTSAGTAQKLQDASGLAAALGPQIERAEGARAAAAERIVGADPVIELTAERAELDALEIELADLAATPGVDPVAADRRADRARQVSERLAARVAEIETAALAGVVQRDELRRRLDGYRAKASAMGRAEDIDLDRDYRRANDALYVAPCDLVEAGRAVEVYQEAVNRQGYPEDRR